MTYSIQVFLDMVSTRTSSAFGQVKSTRRRMSKSVKKIVKASREKPCESLPVISKPVTSPRRRLVASSSITRSELSSSKTGPEQVSIIATAPEDNWLCVHIVHVRCHMKLMSGPSCMFFSLSSAGWWGNTLEVVRSSLSYFCRRQYSNCHIFYYSSVHTFLLASYNIIHVCFFNPNNNYTKVSSWYVDLYQLFWAGHIGCDTPRRCLILFLERLNLYQSHLDELALFECSIRGVPYL